MPEVYLAARGLSFPANLPAFGHILRTDWAFPAHERLEKELETGVFSRSSQEKHMRHPDCSEPVALLETQVRF
jgi:hypothetical protein